MHRSRQPRLPYFHSVGHGDANHQPSTSPQRALSESAISLGASIGISPVSPKEVLRKSQGTTSILEQALKTHTQQKFRELVRRHNKLFHVRTDALRLHTSLDYEIQGLREIIRFVTKQAEGLSVESSNFAAEVPSDQYIVCDKLKFNALMRDIKQFEQQSNTVTDIGRQLLNLEIRLQSEESNYALTGEDLLRALDPDALKQTEDLLLDWQVVRAESEMEQGAELHPLVEQYLDKLGDQGIYQERLFELDAEHSHQRAFRIFEVEHDRPPPTPDSLFESRYNEERAVTQLKFDTLKQEAERLQKLCSNEGLLIDFAEPHLDDQDASQEPSNNFDDFDHSDADSTSEFIQPTPLHRIPLLGWMPVQDNGSTFEGGLQRTETIDNNERILDWSNTLSVGRPVDDPVTSSLRHYDEAQEQNKRPGPFDVPFSSTDDVEGQHSDPYGNSEKTVPMKRRKTYSPTDGNQGSSCTNSIDTQSPSPQQVHCAQRSDGPIPKAHQYWSLSVDKLKSSVAEVYGYFTS